MSTAVTIVTDIKDFFKYLNDNQIFLTVIATIISGKLYDIMITFIDGIIMPILNRDGDNDGTKDIKIIEDYKIKIMGIEFKIGKVSVELIRFIIIIVMMYFLVKILKK